MIINSLRFGYYPVDLTDNSSHRGAYPPDLTLNT